MSSSQQSEMQQLRLQQQQMLANSNFGTPQISMEQFMQYQLRQEVIENARMRATMNNMIQTFFPGCTFDANSFTSNATASSSVFMEVPSINVNTPQPQRPTTTTPPFTENAQTQRSIAIPKKGANNFSKQLPCVAILELRCIEVKSSGELCNEKVTTEEELLAHLELKHGILKFRCLSKGCRFSFDRRKDLETHIAREHKGNLACRHCPKRLKNSYYFEKHFKLFHQKGLYQCIRCIHVREYHAEMRAHIKKKSCFKNGAYNFVDPMRNLRSADTTSSAHANVD